MKHWPCCHRSSGMFLLLASCILLLLLGTGRGWVHPTALAQTIRIIFLHHSCGQNLIEQGGVREGLTALGYEFYDHGYNGDGLRLADGSYSGMNFDVPDDNTDPDGLAAIFAQPFHDSPDNTFSHLMQYDVIAFKSCFPTSNIGSDEQLAEYKSYYLAMRDRMDEYPDKVFIAVTQPPQVPANSDPEEGARARAFADWLQSGEYLAGHPNVFVFDFFGYLAGDDNFLRPEYRVDEYDGHPNEEANRTIGPLFVAFVDQAIQSAGAEGARPEPAAPTSPAAEPTSPPVIVMPLVTAGLLDDFEASEGLWGASADEEGSTLECGPDVEMAHGGATSLRMDYTLVPNGWGSCGQYFESAQDWRDGDGLSLWLHSGEEGQWGTLELFAGDPAAPTPFEVVFETTAESTEGWTQLIFPWTDFVRAEWADEGGLAELDPGQITGFAFSLGAGEERREGSVWVDDVGLATGEEPPSSGPAASPTSVPIAPPTAEPVASEEPGEEDKPGGGICPFAPVALPLGALGLLLARRRRE